MFSARRRRNIPLHLMLLPGLAMIFIFKYVPMAGVVMAFQKFVPVLGIFKSKWVGLANFEYMLNLPNIGNVVWNTFFISILKIISGLIIPVTFALLLNEVRSKKYKRTVQTLVYFPFFLSWVILGSILTDILSPSTGIVNQLLKAVGLKPIYFLGNEKWFPFVLVISDTWKNFGYLTVIYLAALTNIDPALNEAATVDGANRWQQTWHITLPGIAPIIMLMIVLNLGNVLNAGFEQVFNLYSPQVYSTGDIIDTLVYRIGLIDAQFSLATSIGLLKSLVSLILIASANHFAGKYAGYQVF